MGMTNNAMDKLLQGKIESGLDIKQTKLVLGGKKTVLSTNFNMQIGLHKPCLDKHFQI